MFRNMCSKSAKRESAIKQLMDMSALKRILVHKCAEYLPRQKYTGAMTGLEVSAGHKQRAIQRSDLSIEDSKHALTQLVRGVHTRASEDTMDVEWNRLVKDRCRDCLIDRRGARP